MADLSNRALALLLVVAIVVSVSGTIMSLSRLDNVGAPTGFAAFDNETGTTTFTISSNFSIQFVDSVLPFGTGTVQGGGPCDLGTNASNPGADVGGNCFGFNATLANNNLTINNDGNIRANVSLNFSEAAASLIAGTSPSLQYVVYQHEASSCGTIQNGSSFEEVVVGEEVNISGVKVCNNLDFADSQDTLGVAIWMQLPENAPTGARTLTIYAIGCDDNSC